MRKLLFILVLAVALALATAGSAAAGVVESSDSSGPSNEHDALECPFKGGYL